MCKQARSLSGEQRGFQIFKKFIRKQNVDGINLELYHICAGIFICRLCAEKAWFDCVTSTGFLLLVNCHFMHESLPNFVNMILLQTPNVQCTCGLV